MSKKPIDHTREVETMSSHYKNAVKQKQHILKLEAPTARSVVVTGSFCGWSPAGHPLKHDGQGNWQVGLALPAGCYEYRYLIDGQWSDDPVCRERMPNPFGSENCVLQV